MGLPCTQRTPVQSLLHSLLNTMHEYYIFTGLILRICMSFNSQSILNPIFQRMVTLFDISVLPCYITNNVLELKYHKIQSQQWLGTNFFSVKLLDSLIGFQKYFLKPDFHIFYKEISFCSIKFNDVNNKYVPNLFKSPYVKY